MILRVLAALCLLFAAFEMPSAAAQQRKAALVIGNGAYRHAPHLPKPPNDARAMANVFRNLGFDVTLGVDLDQQGMRETLRTFALRLERTQIAVLYYAGHMLTLSGESYLLPVDANIADERAVHSEALDLASVLRELDDPSRTKIVILDASRENPFTTGLLRPLSMQPPVPDIPLAPATVVLSATPPGGVASDGTSSNSRFTEALIKELSAPGIDVETLVRRVRAEVESATQGRQVPWSQSNLAEEVRLDEQSVPAPPKAAAVPEPSAPPGRTERVERERLERESQAALKRAEQERQAAIKRTEREQRELERKAAAERARQAAAEAAAARQAREESKRSVKKAKKSKPGNIEVSPPPSPLPASSASDEHVARFPTIEAADRVVAGATTTVLVSLTVDKVTPEVAVTATGGGTKTTPQGALSLPMPADATRMAVKVVCGPPALISISRPPRRRRSRLTAAATRPRRAFASPRGRTRSAPVRCA